MSGSLSDAERQASRWIARLEADDVSLADHKRFRAWLARSSENRSAYEDVARTWDKLDLLKFLEPAEVPEAPPRSRRWLLLSGAVGVGVIATAAGFVIPAAIEDASATPYATRIGERKNVVLGDGSSAELNADTLLRVWLSPSVRRVRLSKGEALFDVHADLSRPFVVETAFGEVRASGTRFLVKLGAQSARATVFQGAVSGVRPGGLFTRSVTASAGAHTEIILGREGLSSTTLAPEILAHRLAWREGMLAFDGETLADAALELERQTGVRFAFADADAANLRVGGYIHAADLNAFVELVRLDLGLHAHRDGDIVTISR